MVNPIMNQWNSLFCSLDSNTISDLLQQTIIQMGYEPYDAFDLIPGKSYPQTIKAFVAPTIEGWTRILVDDNALDVLETLAEHLSSHGRCLLVHLAVDGGGIKVYQGGTAVDTASALADFLREGIPADEIQRALSGEMRIAPLITDADDSPQVIAIDDLPDDMKQMAQGINLSGAQKMFGKLSNQLLGGGNREDAQQLLKGTQLDWNSDAGMTIRSVMACLTIPDGWRDPDFTTLREAYQRHTRKQRRPNARQYPGDAEMMNAVPDALSYTPVYGGRYT